MKFSTIFTFIVAGYPIISWIPISFLGLESFTIVLLLVAALFLFTQNLNKIVLYKNIYLNFLLIYTVLITMMIPFRSSELIHEDFHTAFLRMGNLVVTVFIVVILLNKNYFKFKLAINITKILAMIFSMHIIIEQFIFNADVLRRPSSIFSEPAHFAYFALVPMAFTALNKDKFTYKRFIEMIIILLGILASTSGQGFIGLIIILIMIVFKSLHHYNNQAHKKIALLFGFSFLIFATILYVFQSDGMISYTISRGFDIETLTLDAGYIGRTRGYTFFWNLGLIDQIFGIGHGNYPVNQLYFSSGARLLVGTGYLSGILLLGTTTHDWASKSITQKALVLIFIGLMIGGGTYSPTRLMYYLSFIIVTSKMTLITYDENEGANEKI